MAVLPLLADPEAYVPNTIDMVSDAATRHYWLSVFEANRPSMVRHAIDSEGGGIDVERRAQAYAEAFDAIVRTVRTDPNAYGLVSILSLCGLRRDCLLAHGFEDPFRHVKAQENQTALQHLPGVLAELDGLSDADRARRLIENVFAGNLFDLGCSGTIAMYESGAMDFHATRDRLPNRPWLVDGLDAWMARRAAAPHRKAVVLIDNAGSDVVLGMIPFVRDLLNGGTQVVIAANTHPALNDVIHDELVPLLETVAGMDEGVARALQSGRLTTVASGNDKPVIDLRDVSDEMAKVSADADLLVIEGMGRALETNFHARFRCDALKLAMVKEQDVATLLGGKLYDVVCRFDSIL